MRKIIVENGQLEAEVKRSGKPAAQKAHGSTHTVLYFEEKGGSSSSKEKPSNG